ncbi:hypothetical protein OSTOST_16351 [Ostertagia ostertagi]
MTKAIIELFEPRQNVEYMVCELWFWRVGGSEIGVKGPDQKLGNCRREVWRLGKASMTKASMALGSGLCNSARVVMPVDVYAECSTKSLLETLLWMRCLLDKKGLHWLADLRLNITKESLHRILGFSALLPTEGPFGSAY